MNEATERSAFEAWYGLRVRHPEDLERYSNGWYVSEWAHISWEAWRSRSELAQPVQPALSTKDDVLDMTYINSLPQPFIGYDLCGVGWPINDFEVSTGMLRIDVCGLLQVKTIADFTSFLDAAGVRHPAEGFYADANPEERLAIASQPVQLGRSYLEDYDLNQSPEYYKGREDGRAAGYGVGYRHATEHFPQSVQPVQPVHCPIGLDIKNASLICSANYCDICKKRKSAIAAISSTKETP